MALGKLAMSHGLGEMAARPCLVAAIACATVVTISAASAQSVGQVAPLTSDQTLALLPDPEKYRLIIQDKGLKPEAVQDIGTMVIDAIGEDHFFGAVAAHVPEGSKQLAIRIRAKLHSLEAAERAALSDCEDERTDGASPCRVIGQIIPEDWGPNTPQISHDVMYALEQKAGELDAPIVVARSRETASWAMWAGENTRQSALDECNETVRATGAEPDCDIVIEDAP